MTRHSIRRKTLLSLSLAVIAVGVSLPLIAQDQAGQQPPDQQNIDQGQPPPDQGQQQFGDQGQPPAGADNMADANDPTRGVGRISVINGEVSVRRGDSGEVTAAAINAPLLSQDRLLTSSSSRAEVQFDSSNMVRLGSNTELRMSDVEQGKYIMELATGTVTFRVLRASVSATTEIDTPSVAVRPLGPGIYRITVREDGSSEITVRAGRADIYSPHGTRPLTAGHTMLARGSFSDPEFQEVAAIGLDDWDRWNQDRDRDLQGSRSYNYVGPDVSGAQDLDNAGTWQNDDTYGNVWVPRVAPGWAPYQLGRWAWEDYYGWSWVSYDPWGWAPYHYGRWYNGRFGWAWSPGAFGGRHYWAPAYVGFFGWGGGVGVGFGAGFGWGSIGWCALAPFERFHPWWGRGYYGGFRGGNFNRTTIVNNVNVTNVYRNARYANAVTAMNSQNFGRTSTVGNMLRVTPNQLRNVSTSRGAVPVTPNRQSLNFSDRSVNASRFPQTANRQFFNHMPVTQVNRVPFAQQQRGLEQAQRQAFHQPETGTRSSAVSRGSQGQANNGATPNRGSAATSGGGWNRMNESSNTQTRNSYSAPANRTPQSSTGGWTHFSQSGPTRGNGGEAVRISPSIVQDRPAYRSSGDGYGSSPRQSYSSPSYNRPSYSSPSYSSPSYSRPSYNSAPSYSRPSYSSPAPRSSAPSGGGRQSAPSGGGGHYSAPSGGGHSSGGGGGHSGGGGGGHHGR
jgi:hypothetical protein